MPEKWVLKLLQKTVAAGATDILTWTSDGNYRLHHIHGYDQNDEPLTETEGTVKIAEKILFKDRIPLVHLRPSELGAINWDVDFTMGEKIEFGVTNNRTTSVTFKFILELERLG